MQDYSLILWQFYNRFYLNLGGKKVPTPYRINLPYQPDRRKYGKWNPSKITHDTRQIAQEQGVDLNRLSVEEIRDFMKQNMLGIDCSGFVYQMLNYLVNKIGKGNLRKNGFPKASSTNDKVFSSNRFSKPIGGVKNTQPGDMIVFKHATSGLGHIILVVEVKDNQITFAHSADSKVNNGIQTGKIIITDPASDIKNQDWSKNSEESQSLKGHLNLEKGDGIRRLRILT